MFLKKIILTTIFLLNLSLFANDTFSVMTFNLNNFFDTYDDPNKDDKAYLPLSLKQNKNHIDACNQINVTKWRSECLYLDWSIENKDKKLNNIVSTIKSFDNLPDIIAFQEIENIVALKDIFDQLKDEGYKDYALIEGNDYRGIDNAFISKFKIQKAQHHKIKFSPKYATKDTRPILEVVISFNNKSVHLYNVHFPAPYHPSEMRIDAFKTLENLVASHTNIAIALGDFNVTSAEEMNNNTFVNLDKDWDISHLSGCEDCKGTYFYKRDNAWSYLDAIMLKEDRGASFVHKSIQIAKLNTNTNNKGEPLTFNEKNGMGVSDHFPVFAKIKIK